ncbi:hypothetical protein ACFL6P_02130 [Candidatus Latescibacterota bacterium]
MFSGEVSRRPDVAETDTRPVVFAFMGQHCHNPIFMEQNLRYMLAKMNWRILFTGNYFSVRAFWR